MSTTEATPDALSVSLLQMLWLASPALPIGGFSYSEGLEAAVEFAGVDHEELAADWLLQQLQLSQGRGDMVVIGHAIQAWRDNDSERIQQLNSWVLNTRESSEFRLQTEQMGASLCAWLRNQYAGDAVTLRTIAEMAALPSSYPIVYAFAFSRSQASVQHGLLTYAFAWAENMVQAAVKSIPLGQSAGQRILQRLVQAIPVVTERAIRTPFGRAQALSPMLAILSSQHEHQYSRLFRS
jgi:urease accessory protein